MRYKSDKRIKRIVRVIIATVALLTAAYLAISNFLLKPDNSVSPVGDSDFVRIIDVGQGDSVLISSNGQNCLIDTGTVEYAEDLCKKLKSYGISKLDVLAVTHFHDDHTGGMEEITERFEVSNLIYPDSNRSETYSDGDRIAKQNVIAEDGEFYVAKQGINFDIGDFEITVIGYYPDIDDENSRSVFYMAKLGDKKFLITGDAETEAENRLLEDNINVSCDVLKVGHHGSNTSTSQKFLNACNPTYSAISCGAGNMYSHPHDTVVSRLEKANTQIYRTDIVGDITFTVNDNNEIAVSTQK